MCIFEKINSDSQIYFLRINVFRCTLNVPSVTSHNLSSIPPMFSPCPASGQCELRLGHLVSCGDKGQYDPCGIKFKCTANVNNIKKCMCDPIHGTFYDTTETEAKCTTSMYRLSLFKMIFYLIDI